MDIVIWVISLTLAITVHEYAHAYVSYRLGDPTPKKEGRLTLNPIKHIDLIGLICLVFLGFGWAAPVRVDPRYYKDERKGVIQVALAGPLANFILVIVGVILAFILRIIGVNVILLNRFLAMLITINLLLGIFNLIPLAPLDGSKIVMGLIPQSRFIVEKLGFIILLVLLLTGKISDLLILIYGPILEFIIGIIN